MLDKNGREIMEGDLLRTFHFRDRTAHGAIRYLYHFVQLTDGHLEMVPAVQPVRGGRCWLTEYVAKDVEIIDGRYRNGKAWYERPKHPRWNDERSRPNRGSVRHLAGGAESTTATSEKPLDSLPAHATPSDVVPH